MIEIIKALRAAYPDKTIPRETIEVYIRCLVDLPTVAVQAAVLNHIATNKWWPTIAEIREGALTILPGYRMPTAAEAWTEVRTAMQQTGGWSPAPQFSHAAITTVVEAIGWGRLCESENGMADRAHFMKMYEEETTTHKRNNAQLPEARRLAKQLEAGKPVAQLPDGTSA